MIGAAHYMPFASLTLARLCGMPPPSQLLCAPDPAGIACKIESAALASHSNAKNLMLALEPFLDKNLPQLLDFSLYTGPRHANFSPLAFRAGLLIHPATSAFFGIRAHTLGIYSRVGRRTKKIDNFRRQPVAIRDMILPEFDREMAVTRTTLERVPEGNPDWAPHAKSMKLGRLAGHIAELPALGAATLDLDSFDINPPGAPPRQPNVMTSRKQVLELFDKNVASARASLAKATDEQLMHLWSFSAAGKNLFTVPRIAAFRSFVISHVIHHRGQLSVYLRMNNALVPSIYGPSADENPFA